MAGHTKTDEGWRNKYRNERTARIQAEAAAFERYNTLREYLRAILAAPAGSPAFTEALERARKEVK